MVRKPPASLPSASCARRPAESLELQEHRMIVHQRILALDGDSGLRTRFAGVVAGRILVHVSVKILGGGEQAQALFLQGLDLGIGEGGRAEHLDGHHGVDHRLVAAVVDLEHHVRAEGRDRIEEDGAAMNPEIALAAVQHDESVP
jgi:hypothetical protein